MDKREIQSFFDGLADGWDADMVRSEAVIDRIMENAQIVPGVRVLDVACGTGVVIPDYLKRGADHVTGIDLSPEMIRVARSKFSDERVDFVCGDVEDADFPEGFDRVVVYNAFPHFPDPAGLVRVLAGLLKPGGVLTVAHGRSRAAINHHHEGKASRVSMGLLHEDELAALFAEYCDVTVKISDDEMYQVAGIKR